MKKAIITGITGQDGSYLAELLLLKGYEVHGIVRRASEFNTGRVDHLYKDLHLPDNRFFLHYGDLTDSGGLERLVREINPDEIYNIGAQSHVKVSFETPEYTADVDALGVLRILEIIRNNNPKIRFYQASSSEMFGLVQEIPQKESTPFYPRSPYGVSKLFGHWITKNYRESYGIFACSGILFNHESPRRGKTFVSRKIVRAFADIKTGVQDCMYLGNLDAKRDWGYAKEYVYAMWLMLQQDKPDDYVIATGETHTVRDFVEESAKYFGYDIVWKGQGLEEIGYDRKTDKVLVRVDARYYRPAEVELLIGDYSKAKQNLNWEPKVKFKELVEIMSNAELTGEKREDFSVLKNTTDFGLDKSARVYVAGHLGLVGSALVRKLKEQGYTNLLLRSREELDLTDELAVKEFFKKEKPEYVFLAAAKVGGILANRDFGADFISDNLRIQNNVIHNSYISGVKKLVFLGSTCIYPKLAPQPLKEEYLLTGPLEPTNEAYAVAKIAGIKMCEYYNKQYGTNYISVMPTNLYGQNDNFDLKSSHVLPAMIRKFYEAKQNNSPEVVLWGTGNPRREFLHVDDLADAVVFLMKNYNSSEIVNIGYGEDFKISEVAKMISDIVGYTGNIVYDTSKPDGTPRKQVDSTKLFNLGWKPRYSIYEGLKLAIDWYIQNVANR